eukprot:comp38453_c0_seq1/m.47354 comp38453_c0_seq1/g.47354  ORF comp38453_c0_seq1/g.47354 comp38453_c0_seq1/m.47354 type:complete len:166 (-) comp38453_c0_seq1:355-852(-)
MAHALRVLAGSRPVLALGFAVASTGASALCEEKEPQKVSSPLDTYKQQLADNPALPFAGAVSFGAITGFCSGYTTAKLGKGAALIFGGVFMTFQAAAWNGYVVVNWDKVEKDVMSALDVNKDGKVDMDDARFAASRTIEILTSNTGGAMGGFTAGFIAGARKGWR